MKYLPPFDLIRRTVEISTVRGELRVNLSYEDFVKLLKMLISSIEVDETWYLKTYEDIALAVREGLIVSGRQHFVDDGYFEGRLPFPMRVDEGWYLQHYADVSESIRTGAIVSGQAHFDEAGYQEGRLPFGM